MRWISTLITIGVTCWLSYMSIKLCLFTIPKLLEMKFFMQSVFQLSDLDLQTILWKDLVAKIISTHQNQMSAASNTTTKPLDPHSIANRIMRKENYLIAMINKEILDLSMPVNLPFVGSTTGGGKRQWLTRIIQDYIVYYGVFGFLFDLNGRFKKRFLKASNKGRLADEIRKRFHRMALLSLLLSPILFFYLIIQSFFKLSEEYRQNPG